MRALAATLLLGCACGGLDNRPLEVGAVTGQLAGCDPSESVVGIVGDASAKTAVDADCRFRIDALAPGKIDLFAVSTAKSAALVEAEIAAAQLTDTGMISSETGAFVHVRISAPSHQKLTGTLTAPDVPLTATALGASGMARLGPFPHGCFRLEVSAAGLGVQAASQCLADGDDLEVDVTFDAPDGSTGHEGCAISGCDPGFTCGSHGLCQ